jgi:hypothetical protein
MFRGIEPPGGRGGSHARMAPAIRELVFALGKFWLIGLSAAVYPMKFALGFKEKVKPPRSSRSSRSLVAGSALIPVRNQLVHRFNVLLKE